jgi:predicted enzyme related to lactoylglutathione lyase
LTARGVQFPQPPVQQPFGWWSLFADAEGNRFALVPRDQ